ncbi:MAG TPA: hypothetical protein VNQ90_07580 [Chthoniobacteraceae bacterium]|nr:hypothetical protein [Chthoniobacteraceae bacterium]
MKFPLAIFSLLLAAGLLDAAPSPLLFRAPFEKTLDASVHGGPGKPIAQQRAALAEGPDNRPAVSIPVNGQLVYEGSGNFYLPSGNVSFWWRPDAPVQSKEADVLSLSGMQRFYFCRWLRIATSRQRLMVALYHGDWIDGIDDAGAVPPAPKPRKSLRYETWLPTPLSAGQWYHVSISWDMARGLACYLDGELVKEIRRPWFYGGNANHISLAARSTSYSKPAGATFPQSFADVQILDHWIDGDDVARIMQGEAPVGGESLEPMLEERAKRLGLGQGLAVPQAGSGEALWLTQAGLPVGYDVLRRSHGALDGDLGRAWPMYQGYRDSGKTLLVDPVPGTKLNMLQTLGSGEMSVAALDAQGNETPLLEFNAGGVAVAAAYRPGEALAPARLKVRRENGALFHLGAFEAGYRAMPKTGSDGWSSHLLSPGVAAEAGEPLLQSEYPPYDRTLLTTTPAKHAAATLRLPARRASHLLGPVFEEQTGLGAIALSLAVEKAPKETDLTVMLVDPVSYERKAMVATFRAVASTPGKGMRLEAVLDVRDLVYPKGSRPWLIIYPANDLDLQPGGSTLAVRTVPVAVAKKEFVEDQMALINDAFQERSEGRPWSRNPKQLKLLGSLLGQIDYLRALEPDNQTLLGYWHWTHPKEPTPKVKLPPVPEGVPPWAFYTEQATQLFRKQAHWWIDHRQTPSGEFGAPDGINDDTDLIQDWLAIDLMNGPDEKIRRSVEKVADISWRLCTTDGVSNQVTDTLHIYEWGINAQTLAFLLNYGDPVYYQRLLDFASRYPGLMTETRDGKHLHFRSWYFGANRTITEGIYGRDLTINALLLQPAMLLGWYNGDANATGIVSRWTASMRDHMLEQAPKTQRTPGVAIEIPSEKVIAEPFIRLAFSDAVWASYKLTGERSFRDFAGQMIDWEISRKPTEKVHATASLLGAYLRETGDDRWDEEWRTRASDPELWKRSLHNNNYKDLDAFYAAWLRTGENRWLDEGSKLALYHLTWSMPMLTEAEATTDRVWLPQRLANQTTLGGFSILRNQIFPKHAMSWENASGRFAPLVRVQTPERLEAEVWNLEAREVTVNARFWALAGGRYEVIVTTGVDTDANTAHEVARSEATLERYSSLPLKLPAGGVARLELRLKEPGSDVRQRADLAISPLDSFYDAEKGTLTCQIHNIGSRPSAPFRVVVSEGGKELLSREFEALPPPEAFKTARHAVVIPIQRPEAPLEITIALAKDVDEITLSNNRLTIVPQNRTTPPAL